MPLTESSIDDRLDLRPVTMPDDEPFLTELYFSVRDDLRGLFDDEKQTRQLMLMQYRAQAFTYGQQYPDASNDVIMLDGTAVGRIIVDRGPGVTRLVDISLVPASRDLGIGTSMLRRLCAESAGENRRLVLQVLKTNPAVSLYERMGFRVCDDDGTRLSMEWDETGLS